MKPVIQHTAIVEAGAELEEDVKVWHFAHVRKGAKLGRSVSIGKDVYVDADVTLGEGTRVQNGVNLYKGVQVGSWCFIGPAVVFTNDQHPRVGRKNWQITPTVLEDGCSLGAGAIVRCGVRLGAFCMIGAGAVVTKDVPPFGLVTGVPAEMNHRVCACGDLSLSLATDISDCVQACCHENLTPESLALAQAVAARFPKLKRA